jgi:hypothetical protein
MSSPLWGLVAGLVFGAVAVGMMLPMAFPDKRTALLGAFVDRLGIGIVIGCVHLPWSGWAVGLLLSLPSAVITKAYVPILVLGGLGGLVIGGLLHGWQSLS